MKEDVILRPHTPYYHVSFADEQWEELPALSRQWMNAADLEEYLQLWNSFQNKVARNKMAGFNLLAFAVFVTIEVHHV